MTNGKYVPEQELNERAVAPRVTLETLEANIMSEHYFTAHQGARAGLLDGMITAEEQPNSADLVHSLGGLPAPLRLLTFCVLVLKNGFTVVGQSACASPENYQQDIGQRVARGDAIRQVWSLMGYELRSQLVRIAELRSDDDRLEDALTRLTAFGMGNREMLRSGDADRILSHFLHSESEALAGTAREAVVHAVELEQLPEAPPLGEPEDTDASMSVFEIEHMTEHLVETNELGARHPEEHDQPVAASEAPELDQTQGN